MNEDQDLSHLSEDERALFERLRQAVEGKTTSFLFSRSGLDSRELIRLRVLVSKMLFNMTGVLIPPDDVQINDAEDSEQE